jgi:hypothetical protein
MTIRVFWKGNGKFYYFKTIEGIFTHFTRSEIEMCDISIIYGSQIVGEINTLNLLNAKFGGY